MPDTRRTAYWTTRQQQPADRSVCWRLGCTNQAAAVQSDRWRGAWCDECLVMLERDAERGVG